LLCWYYNTRDSCLPGKGRLCLNLWIAPRIEETLRIFSTIVVRACLVGLGFAEPVMASGVDKVGIMTDRVMLPPNLGWGRRRGQYRPKGDGELGREDPNTASVNMMPEGNNRHNQSDEPLKQCLETRWREERAAKAQNKRTRTAGSFEGDVHTRRDSGSQSHLRTIRTEGASIVQIPSTKFHQTTIKALTPSTGQSNRTTTSFALIVIRLIPASVGERSACSDTIVMGHYKRDCSCNHKGPVDINIQARCTNKLCRLCR
ncbi:hypothetical protein HAX54_010467, partial [Datura stramonium]|nr:hypothetical protein [Datura stramonium]